MKIIIIILSIFLNNAFTIPYYAIMYHILSILYYLYLLCNMLLVLYLSFCIFCDILFLYDYVYNSRSLAWFQKGWWEGNSIFKNFLQWFFHLPPLPRVLQNRIFFIEKKKQSFFFRKTKIPNLISIQFKSQRLTLNSEGERPK